MRPCKSYEGVRSRYSKVDLVVVRENTEDLYAGIESRRAPSGARLIDWVEQHGQGRVREGSGISLKPISVTGTRRIVEFAFDYARKNGRRKVTAVHKANIMKFTDGLFLRVAREVAEEQSDIEFEDRIVDNLWMQLVQRPEEYDVLVARTSTATSSPTSAPASSAGSASRPAVTSARTRRCSSPRTARPRSTRAKTR